MNEYVKHYKKEDDRSSLASRLLDGLYNFITVLVVIYVGTVTVLLILGLIGLLIDWIISGQINPLGHNGIVVTSEFENGNGCYNGEYPGYYNCFRPINSNMFWLILTTGFIRISLFMAVLMFIFGLADLKLKLKED